LFGPHFLTLKTIDVYVASGPPFIGAGVNFKKCDNTFLLVKWPMGTGSFAPAAS